MTRQFGLRTARQDPRFNLCDFYLFGGSAGNTAMAMTVNPNSGRSSPDTFSEDGLYAFRFDLNDDAREEVAFKMRFSSPRGEAHGGDAQPQSFEVRRAAARGAERGDEGEVILRGRTGETIRTNGGLRAYAGLVPDLFGTDCSAINRFAEALHEHDKFLLTALQDECSLFELKNVTAIVLEVPTALIGDGQVHAWATASIAGCAPEVQVSRNGLPLIERLFIQDGQMRDDYNCSVPAHDVVDFSMHVEHISEKLSSLAGCAADPVEHAKEVAKRLCPFTLPYTLGTSAAFDFAGFNGRRLTDNVLNVVLSLASDSAVDCKKPPPRDRTHEVFPYFGPPYSPTEHERLM